ncbi:hypothetical protein [Halopelagius fulvigenes]|uniref:Uncharacterized protein n=1 Tax=Halopelagius fulvigenes TaxID=1198324 RepID=A0ABD5U3R3_9EURY
MSTTNDPDSSPYLRLYCPECETSVPRTETRRQYAHRWHVGCGAEVRTPTLGDL